MAKKTQIKKFRSSALSWALFIGTIEVAIITTISVLFPALIVRSASLAVESIVDTWETGVWAVPFILCNLTLLGIVIAYHKKFLPEKISNSIKFIFNFEVSKKVALIVLVILLIAYISYSVGEISEVERHGDFPFVLELVQNWNMTSLKEPNYQPHFRLLLLSSSIDIFDNIRVAPFIVSIALLLATYFITYQLSQKRFAGLVAMAILLQSPVFLKYDTEATYENIWTLMYIISLLTIYKAWPLSPISYVLSIFSKQMTAIFFPMTIFFVYRAKIPRKRKIRLIITYVLLASVVMFAIFLFDIKLMGDSVPFDEFDFWHGFTALSFQLRFDFVVVFFLIPLIVGLFIASRRGISQADSIMFLIAWMLFISPLMTGFTDLTNQPYRFVPLVVFFAMGVGVILSKREEKISEQV